MITLSCDYCGEVFERRECDVTPYRKHYCNRECQTDDQFLPDDEIPCPVCDTPFVPYLYRHSPTTGRLIKHSRRKTCSRSCGAKLKFMVKRTEDNRA